MDRFNRYQLTDASGSGPGSEIDVHRRERGAPPPADEPIYNTTLDRPAETGSFAQLPTSDLRAIQTMADRLDRAGRLAIEVRHAAERLANASGRVASARGVWGPLPADTLWELLRAELRIDPLMTAVDSPALREQFQEVWETVAEFDSEIERLQIQEYVDPQGDTTDDQSLRNADQVVRSLQLQLRRLLPHTKQEFTSALSELAAATRAASASQPKAAAANSSSQRSSMQRADTTATAETQVAREVPNRADDNAFPQRQAAAADDTRRSAGSYPIP